MKKIDLHIHTKSSISDSDFEFSLSKLKEYVESLNIDCIAITNHNLFDLEQFNEILDELEITVLPGVEINLEKGHLLLISENDELEDFESRCAKVEKLIKNPKDFISIEVLKEIFPDLNRYLLIPHYDKKPIIRPETLEKLKENINAGEVTSPKKFKYCIKDSNSLTPVLFSDLRFKTEMKSFSPRQTYIDIDETSIRAIKTCFADKSKTFLTEEEGHSFFQVFENGQKLSNGLNVILGKRSSGKSYTLKRIFNDFENVKYIKQFELLEKDEEKDKKRFNELLNTKQSSVSEEFLKEFKSVLEDVVQIDEKENSIKIEKYLDSVLKVAAEEEKKDVYSKCALFNEIKFTESNNETLKKLIEATKLLIENKEYRDLIDKHVAVDELKNLIIDLILKYREQQELNHKRLWVNSIISNVKGELQSNTAYSSIEDLNVYDIQLEKQKLNKFEKIVDLIKKEDVGIKIYLDGWVNLEILKKDL